MSSAAELRAAALKPRPRKSQIITFDGLDYEIRAPSVALRGEILRRAGALEEKKGSASAHDVGRFQVAAVVGCTFAPGTEDPIFTEADIPALLAEEAGGVVDALAEVALRFVNVSSDKVAAKNA